MQLEQASLEQLIQALYDKQAAGEVHFALATVYPDPQGQLIFRAQVAGRCDILVDLFRMDANAAAQLAGNLAKSTKETIVVKTDPIPLPRVKHKVKRADGIEI